VEATEALIEHGFHTVETLAAQGDSSACEQGRLTGSTH
jgi:hypothetical protein